MHWSNLKYKNTQLHKNDILKDQILYKNYKLHIITQQTLTPNYIQNRRLSKTTEAAQYWGKRPSAKINQI